MQPACASVHSNSHNKFAQDLQIVAPTALPNCPSSSISKQKHCLAPHLEASDHPPCSIDATDCSVLPSQGVQGCYDQQLPAAPVTPEQTPWPVQRLGELMQAQLHDHAAILPRAPTAPPLGLCATAAAASTQVHGGLLTGFLQTELAPRAGVPLKAHSQSVLQQHWLLAKRAMEQPQRSMLSVGAGRSERTCLHGVPPGSTSGSSALSLMMHQAGVSCPSGFTVGMLQGLTQLQLQQQQLLAAAAAARLGVLVGTPARAVAGAGEPMACQQASVHLARHAGQPLQQEVWLGEGVINVQRRRSNKRRKIAVHAGTAAPSSTPAAAGTSASGSGDDGGDGGSGGASGNVPVHGSGDQGLGGAPGSGCAGHNAALGCNDRCGPIAAAQVTGGSSSSSISELLGASNRQHAATLLASMSRKELFAFAAKAVGSSSSRPPSPGCSYTLDAAGSSHAASGAGSDSTHTACWDTCSSVQAVEGCPALVATVPGCNPTQGPRCAHTTMTFARPGGCCDKSLPLHASGALLASEQLKAFYSKSMSPQEAADTAKAAADAIVAAAKAAAARSTQNISHEQSLFQAVGFGQRRCSSLSAAAATAVASTAEEQLAQTSDRPTAQRCSLETHGVQAVESAVAQQLPPAGNADMSSGAVHAFTAHPAVDDLLLTLEEFYNQPSEISQDVGFNWDAEESVVVPDWCRATDLL